VPTWQDGQSEADFSKVMTQHQKAEARIFGHLEILVDNGYLEGIKIRRLNNNFGYSLAHPRLTMAGHELLDTMRSKPVWEQIKSLAKTKGLELTLDVIKGATGLAVKSVLGG
jgi:hypothetical protein